MRRGVRKGAPFYFELNGCRIPVNRRTSFFTIQLRRELANQGHFMILHSPYPTPSELYSENQHEYESTPSSHKPRSANSHPQLCSRQFTPSPLALRPFKGNLIIVDITFNPNVHIPRFLVLIGVLDFIDLLRIDLLGFFAK